MPIRRITACTASWKALACGASGVQVHGLFAAYGAQCLQRLALAQQRAHGLLPEIGSGRDRYGGKQHAFSGFSEGW